MLLTFTMKGLGTNAGNLVFFALTASAGQAAAAPATVRERHYAPATDEQTRAAIELIPPMDWGPGIATVQWGYGVPTVAPRNNVVRLRGA